MLRRHLTLTVPIRLRRSPLTVLFAKCTAFFIPCVFIYFRTLCRNGALPSPLPSTTSALFPMQRRVGVLPGLPPVFHIFFQVTYILSSFLSHSYKNCRGVCLFSPYGTEHPMRMRVLSERPSRRAQSRGSESKDPPRHSLPRAWLPQAGFEAPLTTHSLG